MRIELVSKMVKWGLKKRSENGGGRVRKGPENRLVYKIYLKNNLDCQLFYQPDKKTNRHFWSLGNGRNNGRQCLRHLSRTTRYSAFRQYIFARICAQSHRCDPQPVGWDWNFFFCRDRCRHPGRDSLDSGLVGPFFYLYGAPLVKKIKCKKFWQKM